MDYPAIPTLSVSAFKAYQKLTFEQFLPVKPESPPKAICRQHINTATIGDAGAPHSSASRKLVGKTLWHDAQVAETQDKATRNSLSRAQTLEAALTQHQTEVPH